MSMQRNVLSYLAAFATLAAGASAQAQAVTFYLDRAQVSGAPDDGFMVWRPTFHDETRFYGNLAMGYTLNPLRADTVTPDGIANGADPPVSSQLISYLSLGTELLGRGSVNVSFPIALYQDGSGDVTNYGVTVGDATAAPHDTRLDGRFQLYESDDRQLRIGIGLATWLPTGNEDAYTSDAQATAHVFGAGEYDFKSFFLAGQLGPHFRPYGSLGGIQDNRLFIADEVRWSLGGYVPLRDGKIRLGLELWGSTGMTNDINGDSTLFRERNTDLEWLAQGRFLFLDSRQLYVNAGLGTRLTPGYGAPDLRVLASVGYWLQISDEEPDAPARRFDIEPTADDYEKDTDGDGYPDGVDSCPTIPEDGKPPKPADGCPANADRDGDGIPDLEDSCPDVPEDLDGIQDEDGCPEEDADNDKIPDVEDRCPEEPGPRSEIAEKNGCPSLTRFEEGSEIQLLEPIQFEFGKATIKPVSFPILDEVVSLMKARPDVNIAVHGHTDSVGSDAANLTLSKNRAASVMKYLISKGIPKGRLESEGFGESQPLESNGTDAGRAKNRRVEFKVID